MPRSSGLPAALLVFAVQIFVLPVSGWAAGTPPAPSPTDPTLRRAGPLVLRNHVRTACADALAEAGDRSAAARRGCACYAERVVGTLDGAEIDTYRQSGTFSASAQAKAVAALQMCGLR